MEALACFRPKGLSIQLITSELGASEGPGKRNVSCSCNAGLLEQACKQLKLAEVRRGKDSGSLPPSIMPALALVQHGTIVGPQPKDLALPPWCHVSWGKSHQPLVPLLPLQLLAHFNCKISRAEHLIHCARCMVLMAMGP